MSNLILIICFISMFAHKCLGASFIEESKDPKMGDLLSFETKHASILPLTLDDYPCAVEIDDADISCSQMLPEQSSGSIQKLFLTQHEILHSQKFYEHIYTGSESLYLAAFLKKNLLNQDFQPPLIGIVELFRHHSKMDQNHYLGFSIKFSKDSWAWTEDLEEDLEEEIMNGLLRNFRLIDLIPSTHTKNFDRYSILFWGLYACINVSDKHAVKRFVDCDFIISEVNTDGIDDYYNMYYPVCPITKKLEIEHDFPKVKRILPKIRWPFKNFFKKHFKKTNPQT